VPSITRWNMVAGGGKEGKGEGTAHRADDVLYLNEGGGTGKSVLERKKAVTSHYSARKKGVSWPFPVLEKGGKRGSLRAEGERERPATFRMSGSVQGRRRGKGKAPPNLFEQMVKAVGGGEGGQQSSLSAIGKEKERAVQSA